MNKKVKRILAWIAIIAIVAVYVIAIVFAFRGGDLAIPVTMSCILIVAYLSFYFHLGRVFVNIFSNRRKKVDEKIKGEEQAGKSKASEQKTENSVDSSKK